MTGMCANSENSISSGVASEYNIPCPATMIGLDAVLKSDELTVILYFGAPKYEIFTLFSLARVLALARA